MSYNRTRAFDSPTRLVTTLTESKLFRRTLLYIILRFSAKVNSIFQFPNSFLHFSSFAVFNSHSKLLFFPKKKPQISFKNGAIFLLSLSLSKLAFLIFQAKLHDLVNHERWRNCFLPNSTFHEFNFTDL